MGELLDTRQTVRTSMQAELRTPKAQIALEGVWDLLVPTQREAVFQTVVQVCRQLVHAHQSDGKEGRNE